MYEYLMHIILILHDMDLYFMSLDVVSFNLSTQRMWLKYNQLFKNVGMYCSSSFPKFQSFLKCT